MDLIRYIYRYVRNSIIRVIALIFSKKLVLEGNVLIVSPHPDDEILGCGALIKKMNAEGKSVSIVFLTKGENTTNKIDKEKLITERKKLALSALQYVGQPLEKVFFLDYEDGKVNSSNPETLKLKELIEQINPKAIFVTHKYEGWNDHVQANSIISKIAFEKKIKAFEYCVWFWYTMPFNKIFDIKWVNARHIQMNRKDRKFKISAINIYTKEREPLTCIQYSGALPKILIKSCGWSQEFYFEM